MPQSDPVLRLIEPDELCLAFLALPETEQRWRGRLFLATLWLSHHVPYSWSVALSDDEVICREYRSLMEAIPDLLFVDRVHGLRAELALETGKGLVAT